MNKSEMLDGLEEIIINALLPAIREIKKTTGISDIEDTQMARNLISQVGTRIAFGKDFYDRSVNK